MTTPDTDYKLETTKVYGNGVIYEHWHHTIDNCHHIHLPDGMTIIFEHEDAEGSIKIKEEVKSDD